MMLAIKAFILKFKIYFMIGALIIAFGFGWYMRTVFYDAKEKRNLQAAIDSHIEGEKQANLKVSDLEKQLSEMRTQDQQTNQEVKNEVTKIVYKCKLPESGKLLINKAITGDLPR